MNKQLQEPFNVAGGLLMSGLICFGGALSLKMSVLLLEETTTAAIALITLSILLCLGVYAFSVKTALKWGSKPTALAVVTLFILATLTVIGYAVTPPAELVALYPVSVLITGLALLSIICVGAVRYMEWLYKSIPPGPFENEESTDNSQAREESYPRKVEI